MNTLDLFRLDGARIIVTGAAGFIGSHLVAALLQRDDVEVVGIDSFNDSYDPKIKETRVERLASPRFAFYAEDLLEADLALVLGGASVIFHLAGQAGVRTSWGTDFRSYTDRNILATQRLLEFVHQEHPVDVLERRREGVGVVEVEVDGLLAFFEPQRDGLGVA